MIQSRTLEFLRALKENNSKEWLTENRADYDFAKDDVLGLAEQLITLVSEFDETIARAFLDPKKCITRLNRDLRFSKDKTPYKTDYYIVLNKDGKNSSSAFYYLHLEPGNCSTGGGIYNPSSKRLNEIREKIDYSFKEWKAIVEGKSFTRTFASGIHNSGTLVRIPRGFDDNSPAKDYLKMKGFFTMEPFTDEEMCSSKVLGVTVDYFKAVKPLVDYLNSPISKQT